LVSAAATPGVITLLGESLWSSATFRSLRVIIGGHALILSRWSPILAWVDSAASYLLRVAFLSPSSVLVVCSQDWRSMAWSGRAGGLSRQQLGGCEMMLFGGFTRRWSFTFCRLYLGGCADPCSYFFFYLLCKRFPSLLCIGLAMRGFIYKAGRKPISRNDT
jgi:hypothetical protein